MPPRVTAERVLIGMGAALLALVPLRAQPADPIAPLTVAVAAAERALQAGERQLAESHFRAALLEGWMLTGALASGEGRLTDARDAFGRAAAATASSRVAEQALATVQLQLGETEAALRTLSRLAGIEPQNMRVRRLLAQTYIAGGHLEAAVQELEEAHTAAPDDLETTFALASGYARVKKLDAAERLFAELAKQRPIPQTHLLIGRAYRDAGVYDRATAALKNALAMDPRIRRAHYTLGMVALLAEGVVRVEEAIAEFQQERKLAPQDPLTNLRLGMALVVARREQEALAPLEIATRVPAPAPEALEYLGRAQLAVGRAADAATTLERALKTAQAQSREAGRIGYIHYTLATALRQAGRTAEAETHFTEAKRASDARTVTDRERLTKFLADTGDEAGPAATPPLPLEVPALTGATPARRAGLSRQVSDLLARTLLNLGVLQAQADRFTRAATFFEQAAAIEPNLPAVDYSLGVAYFNAAQYARAAPALERALKADPRNTDTARMLAMASLNSGNEARAAELLAADPQRASDPSLEYTYGVALVRSGRGADAEKVFSRLLTTHGTSAELTVVLGQAHAQQGDFDTALTVLRRALEQKPGVAEANATIGLIHLKQGRLAEAAQALRAELAAHPGDVKARYTLATVLDLDGQQDAALTELRLILRNRPDEADARYLQGKILLARGDAEGAVGHLEIAMRIAPADANVRYQLGLAYQKLGKPELAQEQFTIFQRLKDRKKESA